MKWITKKNSELTSEDAILGESGGKSSVYEVNPSSSIPGLLAVETEHGFLYLDPDGESSVLIEDDDPQVYWDEELQDDVLPIESMPFGLDTARIIDLEKGGVIAYTHKDHAHRIVMAIRSTE
jgi:hypothetical protein